MPFATRWTPPPRMRDREPPDIAFQISTRRGTYAGGTSGQAVAKESAISHEGYRRLVAKLPCKACGIAGLSQAAHPNTGKGQGIKTDDRECFPLCADSPMRKGCHPKFDQGAMFSKAVRREIEQVWAADTRRAIEAAGLWPAGLPKVPPALASAA